MVMEMTSSALAFMLSVWMLVACMVIYCYSKMLRSKQRFDDRDDSEQAPGDIHEQR
jgi:H+/Cl- antiporter ClcA